MEIMWCHQVFDKVSLYVSLGKCLEISDENLAMLSWQAHEQIYVWISRSLEVLYERGKTASLWARKDCFLMSEERLEFAVLDHCMNSN